MDTDLDYIIDIGILKKCAEGWSVGAISASENKEPYYVIDRLMNLLGTAGFDKDLGFNARHVYKRSNSLFCVFYANVYHIKPNTSTNDIWEAYRINLLLDQIERIVNDYTETA